MQTKGLESSMKALLVTTPLLPYTEGQERPSTKLILQKCYEGINIFESRKNWIYALNALMLVLSIFAGLYWMIHFRSINGLLLALLYGSLWLSIFSTTYYHRYCSHKAFRMQGKISSWVLKNLGLRLFMEEVFAISHQIHHAHSDTPHDPHLTSRGGFFCYTSDLTMMRTSAILSNEDYASLIERFNHIPVHKNSFEGYQRWGTFSHPLSVVFDILLNWVLWISIAYFIGGAEGVSILGMAAFIWSTSVRNFNYKAHGAGNDKRKEHRDSDPDSRSLNLLLPGIVGGEWHSNHHLYPKSANCGFRIHEIDLSFQLIRFLKVIGLVKSYVNDAPRWYKKMREVSHGS